MSNRLCGDCTACCTGMGVTELNKEPGVTCQHVCKTGCSIYSARPLSCQVFECVWKVGLGRLMERPDKVGFFLDVTDDKSKLGKRVLIAREGWPGSFDERGVQLQLEELSRDRLLILVRGKERKLLGPNNLVADVQKKLRLVVVGDDR